MPDRPSLSWPGFCWPDELFIIFFRYLSARALPAWGRYALSAAIIAAVTVIRATLPGFGLPFILFIPALMAVAFVFGAGPGYLATFLAALLADYLFLGPKNFLEANDVGALAVFTVVSMAIVTACAALGTVMLRREKELAELNRSRTVLARREAFLGSVLAASADCIKVLDLEGNLVLMNENGQRLMEIENFDDVRGRPWTNFWSGKGSSALRGALDVARTGGVGRFRGAADTAAGTPRWWDVMVTPILGPDGRPEQLLAVSRDVSATVQAFERLGQTESQTRLLSNELQHRLQNTLTLVQAMVRQTLRNSPDLSTAQAALDTRLAAMGRAHTMLTASGSGGCELHDVVATALDLHSDHSGRFAIAGPPAYLDRDAATSFAMVLHELGTNAAKYGALSDDAGRVGIAWTLQPEPEQSLHRLDFTWSEQGGPAVEPPKRRGFGSRLIERSLSASLRGDATIDFRRDGVVCHVTGLVSPTPLLAEAISP